MQNQMEATNCKRSDERQGRWYGRGIIKELCRLEKWPFISTDAIVLFYRSSNFDHLLRIKLELFSDN